MILYKYISIVCKIMMNYKITVLRINGFYFLKAALLQWRHSAVYCIFQTRTLSIQYSQFGTKMYIWYTASSAKINYLGFTTTYDVPILGEKARGFWEPTANEL